MERIAKKPEKVNTYNTYQKAHHRLAVNSEIGQRLKVAALRAGDAECEAVADMILESAQPENVYFADDFHNKQTGAKYKAYGSFNMATTRLDQSYAKKRSSQSYKLIVATLKKAESAKGLLMTIVLTMPTPVGIGFEKTFDLFDTAWRLFRKRKFFKDNFLGGVGKEEFTLGEQWKKENRQWDFNRDGYHVHKHLLLYSKVIDVRQLKIEWTESLKNAGKQCNYEFVFNTKNGLANVQRKSAFGEKALRDCSKYICKDEVFSQIPLDQLCEVERVLRNRKLLTTFGLCNDKSGSARRGLHLKKTITSDAVTDDLANYLATQTNAQNNDLNVENQRSESLREVGVRLIKENRRDEWLYYLKNKFARRRLMRIEQLLKIFPFASIQTLSGEVFENDEILFSPQVF